MIAPGIIDKIKETKVIPAILYLFIEFDINQFCQRIV